MAGDWIKMTHALPEKPEVLQISGLTSLSRFEVVGRLFALWRWFDTNTVNGNAVGVTKVTLNECLFGYSDATNFVSAVITAGWLAELNDGIGVVRFDEHISESAKTRAQTAKRVAKSKAKTGNAKGNADTVTKTVPKEEKRRDKDIEQPEVAAVFKPLPELKARGVDEQVAQDWLKVRKAKRAPLTQTALNDVIREADKAGMSLNRAISICCKRSWTGFDSTWLKDSDLAPAGPAVKDYL